MDIKKNILPFSSTPRPKPISGSRGRLLPYTTPRLTQFQLDEWDLIVVDELSSVPSELWEYLVARATYARDVERPSNVTPIFVTTADNLSKFIEGVEMYYTLRITFPNGVVQTTSIKALSELGAIRWAEAIYPEAIGVELIDKFEVSR